MARFSLPIVQIGAGLGAVLMVLAGQWLAEDEGAPEAASIDGAPVDETAAFDPENIQSSQQPSLPLGGGPGWGAIVDAANIDPMGERDPAQSAETVPRLAVIIDDVGHDAETARALMALPVTLSILPYAETAPQIAAEARAAGREVFLHLPMEPVGLDDPGPGAITTALAAGEIAARVEAALARVPGAAGLNNHMGSRATRDPATVAALVAALSRTGLVFVDSLTHPASLAGEAARGAGVAALDRDVFLDAPGADPAAQLDAALAVALERGQAIAIGHPYAATLSALDLLQAKADAAGVELVTVGALARRAEAPI